jgi:hypothetical protein
MSRSGSPSGNPANREAVTVQASGRKNAFYTQETVKQGQYPFSVVDASKKRAGIVLSVGKKGVLSDAEVRHMHQVLINRFPVIRDSEPEIKLAFIEGVQYLLIVNSASVANVDNFGGMDMPELVLRLPAGSGGDHEATQFDDFGDEDYGKQINAGTEHVGPAYDVEVPLRREFLAERDGDFIVWKFDTRIVLDILGNKGHAYMRAVVKALVALAEAALSAYKTHGSDHPLGSVGARITANALSMGIPGMEQYAFVNSIYYPGISPSVFTILSNAKRVTLANASDPRAGMATASGGPGGVYSGKS